MNINDFDSLWASTPKAEKGKNEEIPDGSYTMSVQRCEWKESKNGKAYLSWGLTVVGGEHDGSWAWKKNFLTNATSISFLKKDLAMLGVTLEKLSDFNPAIVLDLVVECTKKTKAGADGASSFTEIYFNKLATGGAEKKADIPF